MQVLCVFTRAGLIYFLFIFLFFGDTSLTDNALLELFLCSVVGTLPGVNIWLFTSPQEKLYNKS